MHACLPSHGRPPHRRPAVCRRRRLSALVGLIGWLVLSAQAQPAAEVERLSFAPRPDGTAAGYVIRVHTSGRVIAFSEPRLDEHGRLDITLFNARLARAYRAEAPRGPVRSYETEPYRSHLRLRFTLDPDALVEAAAYLDRATPDLLIRLTQTSAAPVVARAGQTSPGAPVVTTAGERWKLDTVVIDAGHGGSQDLGAVGAGGVREKDVTLAVARKLGTDLEERLGLRVVYTREDDRFVSLPARGKIANEAGGKLFISIHANAARNRAARGTETYFLGLHKTEAARHVMERENAVVQLEDDPGYYEDVDEQALIHQALASSTYLRASEQLAAQVETQFAERLGRASRGVKQAGFYVLWGASMPAILVELGFLTNQDEAVFLASETGQDALARALFRAVRDFKEIYYEKGLNFRAEGQVARPRPHHLTTPTGGGS